MTELTPCDTTLLEISCHGSYEECWHCSGKHLLADCYFKDTVSFAHTCHIQRRCKGGVKSEHALKHMDFKNLHKSKEHENSVRNQRRGKTTFSRNLCVDTEEEQHTDNECFEE